MERWVRVKVTQRQYEELLRRSKRDKRTLTDTIWFGLVAAGYMTDPSGDMGVALQPDGEEQMPMMGTYKTEPPLTMEQRAQILGMTVDQVRRQDRIMDEIKAGRLTDDQAQAALAAVKAEGKTNAPHRDEMKYWWEHLTVPEKKEIGKIAKLDGYGVDHAGRPIDGEGRLIRKNRRGEWECEVGPNGQAGEEPVI